MDNVMANELSALSTTDLLSEIRLIFSYADMSNSNYNVHLWFAYLNELYTLMLELDQRLSNGDVLPEQWDYID